MNWSRREIFWPALIFVATVLVYLVSLRSAGFIWDDDMYVTSNATLRAPDGLRRIWFEPSALPQYYPLVHTTFWLEVRLFGMAPFAFHAVNAVLHALAAVLLGFILRRLAIPGAWFGAALFALHPVQVESVAWITERKNVLSGVFYFAAALFFLRYFLADRLWDKSGETPRAADERVSDPQRIESRAIDVNALARSAEGPAFGAWSDYALGALCFVCALLSKTVTASLPAALLLVLAWKRGRFPKREALFVAPLLAVGAAMGLITAWIERHHVGAEGEAWDLSVIERCLIAGRALWFYAWKLVWPANLTFIYPRWQIDAGDVLAYAFPLAAVAVVALLWTYRRRVGTGPLVAVLFYAGTLFPALGFLNVFPMRYSFVADHFQYHAAAGLLALFGALMATAFVRLPPSAAWVGSVGPGALLAVLALLTSRQCSAYRDLESLWRDTLAKNPGAWMAHTNLGLMLVRQGKVDEGILHYRESIRLEPSLVEPRLNLGEVLQREGRPDEALAMLEETVAKWPENPIAQFNLGTALCKRRRFTDAIPHLKEALRLRPNFAEVAYNLGTAYMQLRELHDAEEMFREALRIRPDYGVAHNNLAAVLQSTGRADEARSHRLAALTFRAWSLATHDDPRFRNGAEAVRFAEQACRDTAWKDARSLDALAAAYAETGRFDDAVRIGEQAIVAARTAGNSRLGDGIALRVAGYRVKRPYRDPNTIPRPGALPT